MKQTALITGGSSGIGFELAKCFAADGYQIVLVARRKAELEKAAAVIASTAKQSHAWDRHGAAEAPRDDKQERVITIISDLTDPATPQRIVHELTRRKLTIDVLVNNAGYGLLGPFADADDTKTLGMVQLNIMTLTELTKRLVPGMIKRKRGRILNIASTAAFQPGPFMAVYYATKAYVLSFSDALHEELRGTGVSVTTLAPGPTATNFQTRAFIKSVAIFRTGVMDPAVVAKVGYTALMRGQRLVIPGWRNVIGAFFVRFAPRGLVLRFIRSLQT